jgi:hypothetical protein
VLREKAPTKTEKDIAQEQESVMASYVEEWQWKRIVHKMYEYQDAHFICNNLLSLVMNKENGGLNAFMHEKQAAKKAFNSKERKTKRLTREEEEHLRNSKIDTKLLWGQEFVKAILDF